MSTENPKITVNTNVWSDGNIEQFVTFPDSRDIVREIINTKEVQVRQALIDLGWTPPKEG